MQSMEFYRDAIHNAIIAMINRLITCMQKHDAMLNEGDGVNAAIMQTPIAELRRNLQSIGINTAILCQMHPTEPWHQFYVEITFTPANQEMEILLQELMDAGKVNVLNNSIVYKLTSDV